MSEATPCRVCGKPWVKWLGSSLDCHARCAFSAETQRQILLQLEANPRLTEQKIAEIMGTSVGVIRASCKEALRRRAKSTRAVIDDKLVDGELIAILDCGHERKVRYDDQGLPPPKARCGDCEVAA